MLVRAVAFLFSFIPFLLAFHFSFEIFSEERYEITEENFFPEKHWIKVRPSDNKWLFNRIMKEPVLYGLFHDLLFMRTYDKEFIHNEIKYMVHNNANLVAMLNGTAGCGKSKLSRAIAKMIAYDRGMNIRFIVDKKNYDKSGHKESVIKIILNKNFTKTMNCYVTYSFFETTKLVRILNKKDMIIQDEVDKSMGTDSKLIIRQIENVLNINARKNMLSVIFNTPKFVHIGNVNFIIDVFGTKNNFGRSFTRENMITYGILYDKASLPFCITSFKVWETEAEYIFYENESQKRKDAYQKKGGGSTINPDKDIIDECVQILFDRAAAEGITKRDSLKSLARYDEEMSALVCATGMITDVVSFTWDKYSQWINDGIDPGFPDGHIPKFKMRRKVAKPIQSKKRKKKDEDEFDDDDTVQPDDEPERAPDVHIPTDAEICAKELETLTKQIDASISAGSHPGTKDLMRMDFLQNGLNVTDSEILDLNKGVLTKQNLSDISNRRNNEIRQQIAGKRDGPARQDDPDRAERVVSGAFVLEKVPVKTVPLLDYVSNRIREDYDAEFVAAGKEPFYQKIWDKSIGQSMSYDAIAKVLPKPSDGEEGSHTNIGNEFAKVREGSQKDGRAIGLGYYGEDWWALQHNTDVYAYFPSGNDDKPDYIHEDGTVDSVKTFINYRAIYIKPSEKCIPEIVYCREHGIGSFRLIIFNAYASTDNAIVKVIEMADIDRRLKFNPSQFKPRS